MKFSIKDFVNKCDQIPRNLRIWSHLLKKTLMESFIFFCSEKHLILNYSDMNEEATPMKIRNVFKS